MPDAPFDPWSLDAEVDFAAGEPPEDTDPAAPVFGAEAPPSSSYGLPSAAADSALTLSRKPARPSRPPRARAKAPPVDIAALYPKMLSLLRDPPPLRPPPETPVPGSFFPRAPTPPPGAPPADLDRLLSTMAEGLLIGETPEGGTELRLTLRDEFFSGTELRVASIEGKLQAELRPPDISTYYTLNAEIDALAARLRDKGLAVERLELRRP